MDTNAAVLMHSGVGSNRCMILDDDMTGKSGSIRHDDMTANGTVVGNMGPDHQQIVISNASVPSAATGTAMNIDVLPKCVVRADRQKCLFAGIFEVLRRNPDHT